MSSGAGDREERHERDALLAACPRSSRDSGRRSGRLYAFCTRTTGATACASARCSGPTPEMPRCRISPASRSSASAPKCLLSTPRRLPSVIHHVQVIAPELAQVLLNLAAQLIGPRRVGPATPRIPARPDLGDDDQVVWVGRQRGIDQFVGRPQRGEVKGGSVDMVDPQLDRPSQDGDGCRPVVGAKTSAKAGPICVRRIEPKPIRLTTRSPSCQVPDAAAVIESDVMNRQLFQNWAWRSGRATGPGPRRLAAQAPECHRRNHGHRHDQRDVTRWNVTRRNFGDCRGQPQP